MQEEVYLRKYQLIEKIFKNGFATSRIFQKCFLRGESQVHKMIRGCKIEEDVYQTGAFLWRGYTLNTWSYSIIYCNELQ